MKERTIRLHLKLIRLARGMLNAWESWTIDEAIDAGLVELVKDADPAKAFKPLRPNGSSHS